MNHCNNNNLCRDKKTHHKKCCKCSKGPTGPTGPIGETGPAGTDAGFQLITSLLDGTHISGPVIIKANDVINYRSSRPIRIHKRNSRNINNSDVGDTYDVIYSSGYVTPNIFYVDSVHGSDTTPIELRQNPSYPYATIQSAVNDANIAGTITNINVNPGTYNIDSGIITNATLSFSENAIVNVGSAGYFQVGSIVALSGSGASFDASRYQQDDPVFRFGQNNTKDVIINCNTISSNGGTCFYVEDNAQIPSITITAKSISTFNLVCNDRRTPLLDRIPTLNFQVGTITANLLYLGLNTNVSFNNSTIKLNNTSFLSTINIYGGNININSCTINCKILNAQLVQTNETSNSIINNCILNGGIFLYGNLPDEKRGKLTIQGTTITNDKGYGVIAGIMHGLPKYTVYYSASSYIGGIGPFDTETINAVNIQIK